MALKVSVSFSMSERDLRIYNYARNKMSFSVYVKELIEEDMKKEEESIKRDKKD